MSLLRKTLLVAIEEAQGPAAFSVMAKCLNDLIALEVPAAQPAAAAPVEVFTPNTTPPAPVKPPKKDKYTARRPASPEFMAQVEKAKKVTSYSGFAKRYGLGINTVRSAFIDGLVSVATEGVILAGIAKDLDEHQAAAATNSADTLPPQDLLELVQAKAEMQGTSLRPQVLAPAIGVTEDDVQQLLWANPLPAQAAARATEWALSD